MLEGEVVIVSEGSGGRRRFPLTDAQADRFKQKGARIVLAGDLPSPSNPPPGCRFHTRCFHPLRSERCRAEVPLLRPVHGSLAACHYAETPASSLARKPHALEAGNP